MRTFFVSQAARCVSARAQSFVKGCSTFQTHLDDSEVRQINARAPTQNIVPRQEFQSSLNGQI